MEELDDHEVKDVIAVTLKKVVEHLEKRRHEITKAQGPPAQVFLLAELSAHFQKCAAKVEALDEE